MSAEPIDFATAPTVGAEPGEVLTLTEPLPITIDPAALTC